MTDVVTRFAPSPTGYLHVGGARTALFNRLHADRHGGRMLLRIEDTDRERSTPEAVAAIFEGMRWLGIDWDGDPVMQASRAGRHRDVADALLASGKAYRCYATRDELDAMRLRARAEGRSPRYDGRWRDRDPSDAPSGAPYVVRLRAPLDGETAIDDAVQGRVAWANADLDDLVLLRADGTPTYMLAVVVDDHDMGVTQVIRGDDHLTNAARQALIYDALGWPMPAMAHVPLIHSMEGRKLAKRDNAVAVGDYRDMGILPQAMRNHLLRLGWGHGDKEIFSREEMTALFGLEAVGRAPSRFDTARLRKLNGHHIRTSTDDELLAAMEAGWDRRPTGAAVGRALPPLDDALRAKLRIALPGLRKRANAVHELVEGAAFLFGAPDLPAGGDPRAAAVLEAPGAREAVSAVAEALDGLPGWDEAGVEAATKACVAASGAKLGEVAQPLRVALTGGLHSIGLFEVMAALGREETLSRLRAVVPSPAMEP